MPMQRHWDNPEKTIVVCEYIGHWTWDEVRVMRDEAKLEYDELPPDHRVYIIHDWSRSEGVPADTLSQAAKLVRETNPLIAGHVFIGISPLLISLFQVFRRFYVSNSAMRFMFAHNLEDAREKIQQAARSQPAVTQK